MAKGSLPTRFKKEEEEEEEEEEEKNEAFP
jgi:hypothetical protein